MSITPQQESVFLSYSRENRHAFPPVAIGGIGKEPLALVPAVFGGLAVVGAVADQPLGTIPEKIIGFDLTVPDFDTAGIYPEGLIPDAGADEIVTLNSGIYLVNIRVNATVTPGAAYRFEVYINGVASGVYTAQDLSNQSGFLSAILVAPIPVPGGNTVTLYGSADQAGRTFTMQDSSIFLTMIR